MKCNIDVVAGITGSCFFLHSLGPRNNWSDNNVVQEAGGSTYSATSACGQLHQSYQVWLCDGGGGIGNIGVHLMEMESFKVMDVDFL